jgi:hypothetical protein
VSVEARTSCLACWFKSTSRNRAMALPGGCARRRGCALARARPLLQILLLAGTQRIEKLLGLGRRQVHGFEAFALRLELKVAAASGLGAGALALARRGASARSRGAGIEPTLLAWLSAATQWPHLAAARPEASLGIRAGAGGRALVVGLAGWAGLRSSRRRIWLRWCIGRGGFASTVVAAFFAWARVLALVFLLG